MDSSLPLLPPIFEDKGFENRLPRRCSGLKKKSSCQCRRYWRLTFGKIPWTRKWQCTPIFLPGKLHGEKSLVGYSPAVTKSWTRLSTHSKKEEKGKTKQNLQYMVVWSKQGVGFLSRKLGSEPYSACIFLGSTGKVSQHFWFLTCWSRKASWLMKLLRSLFALKCLDSYTVGKIHFNWNKDPFEEP